MKIDIKIQIAAVILTAIVSCTPKVAEVVKEEDVQFVMNDPAKPCRKIDDLPAIYKEEAENAFVLYKDQMMFKKWKDALAIWKTAYQLAPGSNGRIVGHFGDGVTIYSELAKQTDQLFLKQRYVDTILMINKKYEECFTVDATQMARRAFDYFYNLGDVVPEEEQWKTFTRAIEMNDGKMVYFIVNPFTKLVTERISEGRLTLEEGRKWVNLINKAIEDGTKNCKGEECKSWEVVNSYAPERLEALEAVDDFYDCDYYSKKYYALYQLSPDSCDVISLAYARMLRGNCPAENALLKEVKEKRSSLCLARTAPVAAGPLKEAVDAYGDGKYKLAVSKFEEFINSTNDNSLKFKYLMMIAKIYYGDLKNFSVSRKYANDARKYNSKSGEPDLLIGKLYASSGPLCGTGRGFESQRVVWPAIDKFIAARNLDPSVAAEANKLISQYTKYMPTTEDLFLRGIEKGSTYTVPCWINETTRVRSAD